MRDEVSTVLWYLETRLHRRRRRRRARRSCARSRRSSRCSSEVLRSAVPAAHRQLGRRRSRRQSVRHARRHDRHGAPRQLLDPRPLRRRAQGSRRAALACRRSSRRRATSCASRSRWIGALLPDVWEANRRRNADEPVRLKLSFMQGARRGDAPAHRGARRGDARRRAGGVSHAPRSSSTICMLVRENLVTAGAMHACRTTVDPLLATLRAHGLHGFLMDVRDHADNHTAALADIAKQLGLPEFDGDALRRELLGPTPARQRAHPARRRDDARARHLPRHLHDPERDERGGGEHVHRLDDAERRGSAARAAARRAKSGSSISPPIRRSRRSTSSRCSRRSTISSTRRR